jgi:hypothetical protein
LRIRRDLKPDKDHEQFGRAGHQLHADSGEAGQRKVFAGVAGVAVEVVERAEQRDQKDCGDKHMEEDREAIDAHGRVEGCHHAKVKLVERRGT